MRRKKEERLVSAKKRKESQVRAITHDASRDGDHFGEGDQKSDQRLELDEQQRNTEVQRGVRLHVRSRPSGEDSGGGRPDIFRDDRYIGAGREFIGGDRGSGQPDHEIDHEHLDHQSGRGRSLVRHPLHTVHSHRFRATVLAFRQFLVQDGPVPHHRHCLRQCLYFSPHEP